MTYYATAVIPSLDLTSGVHTLQRISGPVVSLSHIGWNNQDNLTVAILKTDTPNVLSELAETLKKFDVPLSETSFFSRALLQAKQVAEVVEFEDIREDSSDNI